MLIPHQHRQLDPRQSSDRPSNNNPRSEDSGNRNNNVFIIVAAIIVFVIALLVIIYFVLRALRRMNCRPKYIPGKYLKEKWKRWNVGASYGQVPGGNQTGETGNQPAEGGSQMDSNTTIRRNTSIRSVITLPAYSSTPKPTEQVIGREGEREGMDVVVEFPETAEEEENRREELMESLYQIRQQRRQEIAEREARRRERRDARERGDFIRLEELRQESRARANSRESVNGSTTNVPAAVALAEAQSRGREGRISRVTYADLGIVRHDGSRVRASSRDSDSRPLLTDAASMNTDGPSRNSGMGFISVHSRGESYSSALSLATGGSDGESLTPVQSSATSMHSVIPLNTEPEDGDVGARNIPPPDYDHLDWGDAPPYEATTSEANNENPPRLRELTSLPTIQIDVASPVSNAPTTPTNPFREEQQVRESPAETSTSQNSTHSPEATHIRESPAESVPQSNNNVSPAARTT